MLQCLHNRRFLFRRALRHFGIFLLRQIIVLPNIQPTFPLDLGDVQRRYLQASMFQHIRFDLLIGRTLLEPGHIHVLQRKLHTHFLRVDFSLGKQDNRLGVSMEWSKIDHVISRIAKYPSNVLIQGESGTGKEVVARTIHNLSGRSGNFVAINCGDIPEGLLQSEFFGYEKGSFTGANREGRMGKFEYADHGTVFLDEIGDMPLSMQVSLLRFIQERTVQRIGSNQTKPVDVRIVAATNKNIEEMIKNQLFRNDLYYRLNIIGITLPPLRDRKDDIPVLAQYFAKSISSQYGLPVPEIDPDVYNIFNRYDWPGNVRELRNVIEKLLIMSDGQRITAHSVYAYVFDYDTFNGSRIAGGEASEKDRIATSLIANRGNVSKTAAEFGIARDTLYRKMKKYGITANRGVS